MPVTLWHISLPLCWDEYCVKIRKNIVPAAFGCGRRKGTVSIWQVSIRVRSGIFVSWRILTTGSPLWRTES